MALGIFTFDFAALINSLAHIIDPAEPEIPAAPAPPADGTSLAQTAEVLQDAAAAGADAEKILDDILLATALSNAVVTTISPDEILKKENKPQTNPPPGDDSSLVTITLLPPPILTGKEDEALRQLIRSLQTSVIHSYQSTDIISENFSHNIVSNCLQKDALDDSESKPDNLLEEKKRNELRLRELQEELRRAMLRNNSSV